MRGERTSDYDYELPTGLIAQEPLPDRAASRLMVVHRENERIEHRRFSDVVDLIPAGDVLVLNTTRVMKARLLGERASGARAEVLLLKPVGDDRSDLWEAMVSPGGKLRPGRRVTIAPDLSVEILEITERRTRVVRLETTLPVATAIERYGHVPLPPYIMRPDTPADASRYQTVYARDGASVAAPTAGLHFSQEVLDALARRGVERADVVLDVGAGTFKPVEPDDPAAHVMHEERYAIPAATASLIAVARARASRVWAACTAARSLMTTRHRPSGTSWTSSTGPIRACSARRRSRS